MKKIKCISNIIGLMILTSGINSLFAAQIQVNTTFTCSTNSECKRKCENLGGTWKPNPGGATLGTCTVKSKLSPSSKATLDSLSVVTKNGNEKGDGFGQIEEPIRNKKIKMNLGFRNKPIQIHGFFNSDNDSSCACLKVCDGNGENCTSCFCDPEGCSSCD